MANHKELQAALAAAIKAARIAGQLIRKNWQRPKTIKSAEQHDIKLELDVRCQQLIVRSLQSSFPHFAILGEEGVSGDPAAAARWVVDPIDGTVNFAYDIPHACVSIALQTRCGKPKPGVTAGDYQTQLGVVYDPFCEELWTAIRGQPAWLNGKIIHASRRTNLAEAVVAVGFAKYDQNLQKMLPSFQNLAHRVRKLRIMGSAALDLVYVASGRFDAYLESGVRLWDIAAGGLILECAGGDFLNRPISADHHYYVLANNGPLRRKLQRLTVKLSPEDHSAVGAKSNRTAWVRNAISEKLERETARPARPRSALGRKLLAARMEYARSGGRALSLDEVRQEVAWRRGER